MSIHTNAVKRGSTVQGTETYTLGLARSEENLEVAMSENSAILLEDNYQQRYEGFDPNSSESYIIFEFMQNKHMEQSISLASEIQKSFGACKRVDRGVRQAGFFGASQNEHAQCSGRVGVYLESSRRAVHENRRRTK